MVIVIKLKRLVKNLPHLLKGKRFTLASLILIAHIFLLGCTSNSGKKEVELLQREKAVLEKENLLLKTSSLTPSKSGNQHTKGISLTKKRLAVVFETQFLPIIEKSLKQEYLNSGGNEEGLNHFGWDHINYVVGDINGDNIADGLLRYSYGWGGTLATSGFAVLIADTGKLKMVSITENYQNCIPVKISNQVLYCTKYEYADGDANCCPSIKTVSKFMLKGSQLVEIN